MGELTIDGLTVRGYRPADADALAGLYNAMEVAVGGHPGYTPDETNSIVKGFVTDPATDTRLVFAPDGTLVAAGVVASPPPGGYRADLWGGVNPARVGAGIGRQVFGWQLTRTAQIRAAVAPDAEWTVEASTNLADERAPKLYERFGLKPVRYFFEMLAPARDGIEAPVPPHLRVVDYEPRFERDLYDAHMEAFSDHWGYQKREFDAWTGFTTRSDTFRPDLSPVAFDGDQIAGYVLAYDDADDDRAYIGQVGTRRPWRRQGLAGGLLALVLAGAARAGKGHAYLGVDADSPTGAVGVYERVGFEVESRAVAYHKPI